MGRRLFVEQPQLRLARGGLTAQRSENVGQERSGARGGLAVSMKHLGLSSSRGALHRSA